MTGWRQVEPFRVPRAIPPGANGARLPGFPAQRGQTGRAALTSSASNEAYTPPRITLAGTHALGGVIDVDPCSCEVANEEVKARRILTIDDDGLNTPWFPDGGHGTAWVNPPGGFLDRETLKPAVRGMSSACAWWYELLSYYRAGIVTSALFYTFRLDVLQNIQAEPGYDPPQAFPFCIFGERPRHWHDGRWKPGAEGEPEVWEPPTPVGQRGKKGAPTHACAVFFLPEQDAIGGVPVLGQKHWQSIHRFREAFEPLGYVRI